MKSISVSRAKTWKSCHLCYDYTYVDKFVPVEQQPVYVTVKGLVLHETFEELLKYENYKVEKDADGKEVLVPGLPYRKAPDELVAKILKEKQEANQLPEKEAEEYHLDVGVRRWLDFKHNYLDKTGHIMYSEKEYNETLFGETKTITILDLLEDCGDGKYVIYDYKTPKSVDTNRYKEQLVVYAYMMACVKGIIQPGSEEYEKVVEHFKLYVFFPLVWNNSKTEFDQDESYQACLKQLDFTTKDVRDAIQMLKDTCAEIDAFDFTKPAEVLQPSKLSFQCNWCRFCGTAPQDIYSSNGKKFEGCPITHFCGKPPANGAFKPVESSHKTEKDAAE